MIKDIETIQKREAEQQYSTPAKERNSIPNNKEGSTVRTVISASICKDNEQVVSPSGVSETFIAGKPTPKLSNIVSAPKLVVDTKIINSIFKIGDNLRKILIIYNSHPGSFVLLV